MHSIHLKDVQFVQLLHLDANHLKNLLTETGAHWLYLIFLTAFAIFLHLLRRRAKLEAAELSRERRIRQELEAYAALEPSLSHLPAGSDPLEASRTLARRVCSTIAEKSVFTRVSMLLRTPEGQLVCLASVGTDDLTLAALHAWADKVVAGERLGQTVSTAAKSFPINLGEWQHFDREIASWILAGHKERRRWRRGLIAPIRTRSGRLLGAIAVCADGAKLDGVPNGASKAAWSAGVARAMGPIESLAERLGSALETEALSARLLRAEKLASLGQLAGGVAHALNNPLTAVLGFADLIAETSSDPRVRQDASTILIEAIKMKETVARLVEFWRPTTLPDQPVDLAGILNTLAAACESKLRDRGIRLQLTGIDAAAPLIRGSQERLRQVLEHLLNNAAEAIASMPPSARAEDPDHAIRITLSHDDRLCHLIVSDTGPGFPDPARAFDPFYTAHSPTNATAGLGLSICYSVLREHGGEISAFNLHPHGAAIVLELPIRQTLQPEPVLTPEPTALPIPTY